MKPHQASLINAVVLIAMSAWAYLASDTPSVTAFIPAAFGVLLLACLPGVKAENKIVAHIAVLLTLVVLVALFMPLRGAIGREDTLAIVRVGLMMATTAFALAMFIKSFIDVRRNRASE
ncbi:MAG: hypothetical protein AAF351_03925 [Pseudomonadota bacterium]